jgi:hypothetical protein
VGELEGPTRLFLSISAEAKTGGAGTTSAIHRKASWPETLFCRQRLPLPSSFAPLASDGPVTWCGTLQPHRLRPWSPRVWLKLVADHVAYHSLIWPAGRVRSPRLEACCHRYDRTVAILIPRKVPIWNSRRSFRTREPSYFVSVDRALEGFYRRWMGRDVSGTLFGGWP